MEELINYKRLIRMHCVNAKNLGKDWVFNIEIRLQVVGHFNVLSYQIQKTKKQINEFYTNLKLDLFDINNPFENGIKALFVKEDSLSLQQHLDKGLNELKQRLDVLTHRKFIQFTCIHLHYFEFIDCLQEQKNNKVQPNSSKEEQKIQSQSLKRQSEDFLKMCKLMYLEQKYSIQMDNYQVIDFTFVRHCKNDLFFVLADSKKSAKVSNFWKSLMNQNAKCGWLKIFKRQGKKITQTYHEDLQGDPFQIQFCLKTSMLMISTSLGVFIYLAKIQAKYERLELFGFVELPNAFQVAYNSLHGELYIIRNYPNSQMHMYSISKEFLAKSHFKFNKIGALFYEDSLERLYISDSFGIHIYHIQKSLQLKKLHLIQHSHQIYKMFENGGYIFALSSGKMFIIESKPLKKEQLMSVITYIALPNNNLKIAFSKNHKKLFYTFYDKNIILIHSIEGGLFSFHQFECEEIRSIAYDQECDKIISLSSDGIFTQVKINPLLLQK